jgi:hypothetical protein
MQQVSAPQVSVTEPIDRTKQMGCQVTLAAQLGLSVKAGTWQMFHSDPTCGPE